MDILDYFKSSRQNFLAEQIGQGQWSAARFLAELLREDSFHETLGKGTLFLLMDGQKMAGFVTLTERDCIDDPAMAPWLGFLYVFPEYRRRGCAGKLLAHGVAAAQAKGYTRVYLATDHEGFYERYGFAYLENRVDVWGENSRIYVKPTAAPQGSQSMGK